MIDLTTRRVLAKGRLVPLITPTGSRLVHHKKERRKTEEVRHVSQVLCSLCVVEYAVFLDVRLLTPLSSIRVTIVGSYLAEAVPLVQQAAQTELVSCRYLGTNKTFNIQGIGINCKKFKDGKKDKKESANMI